MQSSNIVGLTLIAITSFSRSVTCTFLGCPFFTAKMFFFEWDILNHWAWRMPEALDLSV